MKHSVLIIGAESLIGKNFISFCKGHHHSFVATTRRNRKIDKNSIYLELTDDPRQWNIPADISFAVICAGITNLSTCETNQILSTAVNVDGMLKLIDTLQKRGIKIIFLSTSQVFDGSTPFAPENRLQNPVSVYGCQKTIVEKRLMKDEDKTIILRLTKVLHPGAGILGQWVKQLRRHQTIMPFQDMVLSPVNMDQVVSTLTKLINGDYSGIFHLSGNEDISYADMGYFLANRLHFPPERVSPTSADQSQLPKGALPRHTTLNVTRIRQELGIEPENIWQTIDKVIQKEILPPSFSLGNAIEGSI